MTAVTDLLSPDLATAAAAIANARAGRLGAPLVGNVLDILPENLLKDVIEDARAVLAALAALPPKPRVSGKLRAADASALALDLGAVRLVILTSDNSARASSVLWARGVPTTVLPHDPTQDLWAAIARVMASWPVAPPHTPSDHQEAQP